MTARVTFTDRLALARRLVRQRIRVQESQS